MYSIRKPVLEQVMVSNFSDHDAHRFGRAAFENAAFENAAFDLFFKQKFLQKRSQAKIGKKIVVQHA